MKLKKFGLGSMADEQGYDLSLLVGWLEDMANHEGDSIATNGPRKTRVDLVWDALSNLNQALEMSEEE